MLSVTPSVEPISIDEAFLDLRGTERLHKAPPAATLSRLARRIEDELGITVSVGLSYCKFLAKVASDLDKPRGFAVIGRGEAKTFLAGQPVRLIWGVGGKFAERLKADGITHIAQLQALDERTLVGRYGVMGSRLYHFARGEDERTVEPEHEAKSISAENTFDTDIRDFAVAAPRAVAALREGFVAHEGGRPRRPRRHAEAQDGGLQAPDARGDARSSDAARRRSVPRGRAAAEERMPTARPIA